MRSLLRSAWLRPLAILCLIGFAAGCSDNGGGSRFAEIRLLNASVDYRSLDLYVNKDSDDNENLKFQGVGFEGLSDYKKVDSTVYDVKLKRSGVTGTLQTVSGEKQADNTHVTYIAYGATGHFGVLRVSDDQNGANAGKTRLTVLNATDAGGLDVYLTNEAEVLEDTTPQVSGLTSGSSSGAVFIDSGTYRLRIVGAGDASDLRLDLSGVVLESKQVASLIITATPGGVLVGALYLPQGGGLITMHNTKARIRGAAGAENGVSASVGGVTLLTGAGPGIISSRYALVNSGTVAVDLKVGGVAVPVPAQELVPGGDYTMLVWNSANGPRTTLISDDNRISTSSKARLRILNGMSGSHTPITLAVNFALIAEGIAQGEASTYTEFDNGSEYQFDLSDTDTGVALLTRSAVALASQGVYTYLVSGNTTVSGTLRKDR